MTFEAPASLSPTFAEALALAAQLHANQRRKGSGTPYLAHLLAVTAITLEHGASEAEAIAALLHDAVEDQGGEAIWERFNGGRDGTLWYYRGVLDALRRAMQPGEAQLEELAGELDRALATLERTIAERSQVGST